MLFDEFETVAPSDDEVENKSVSDNENDDDFMVEDNNVTPSTTTKETNASVTEAYQFLLDHCHKPANKLVKRTIATKQETNVQNITKASNITNDNIKDAWFNIDKQLLTKDDNYINYIMLNVNKLCYAYKLSTKENPFGYNEEEYKHDTSNVVNHYHNLFSNDVINKPYKVFEHRIGIVTNNPSLNQNIIEKQIKETIDALDDENAIEHVMKHMLLQESFRNIFFYGYETNELLTICLNCVFKHKHFVEILDNKLYPICYLFTPYMFDSELLRNERNQTSIKKKLSLTVASKRKYFMNKLLNYDESVVKNNNYWTTLINDDKTYNVMWMGKVSTEKKASITSTEKKNETKKKISEKASTEKKASTETKKKASTEKKAPKKPVKAPKHMIALDE